MSYVTINQELGVLIVSWLSIAIMYNKDKQFKNFQNNYYKIVNKLLKKFMKLQVLNSLNRKKIPLPFCFKKFKN